MIGIVELIHNFFHFRQNIEDKYSRRMLAGGNQLLRSKSKFATIQHLIEKISNKRSEKNFVFGSHERCSRGLIKQGWNRLGLRVGISIRKLIYLVTTSFFLHGLDTGGMFTDYFYVWDSKHIGLDSIKIIFLRFAVEQRERRRYNCAIIINDSSKDFSFTKISFHH